MERGETERLQEEEGRDGGRETERERERQTKREGNGWREGGREKEGINSSGALIPHYPGRALSPWQCGRKRIAKA